jgi:hypothetical protein
LSFEKFFVSLSKSFLHIKSLQTFISKMEKLEAIYESLNSKIVKEEVDIEWTLPNDHILHVEHQEILTAYQKLIKLQ